MQVLKIGGNELDAPGFLPGLAGMVARSVAGDDEPIIIVHGGGQGIARLQRALGVQPQIVDGLRVTDRQSLWVAQMVLSGDANKRIVQALASAGVRAAGISGVDGGLLRCRKKEHPAADLGQVGEVVRVQPALLEALLGAMITPVVSPISLGEDGDIYNVNADEAAAAIGGAMGARALSFISNVPGVLDEDGRLIATLTAHEAEELLAKGVIAGGMRPKVRAALAALARRIPAVRIVDPAGLETGGGTTFEQAEAQPGLLS